MSASACGEAPIMPAVVKMIKNPGVYFIGDIRIPDMISVLLSMDGTLRSMRPDNMLDPSRFMPTLKTAGPFTSFSEFDDDPVGDEVLAALIDLVQQVNKFAEENGEADFETARALSAIAAARSS